MPSEIPTTSDRITPSEEQVLAKLQTIRKDSTVRLRKSCDDVLAQLRDGENWEINKKRLYPMMKKQQRDRLPDEAQAVQFECIQKGHIMLYGPAYVESFVFFELLHC
jgi:hypothetical protein